MVFILLVEKNRKKTKTKTSGADSSP